MSDELLDEALAAYRDDADVADDTTLDRILETLDADDEGKLGTLDRILETLGRGDDDDALDEGLLDEAILALREEDDAGATHDADEAQLARIAESLQTEAESVPEQDVTIPVRPMRQVALAAAAVLLVFLVGAPTTWAWSTGRLDALLETIGLVQAPEPERESVPASAPAPASESASASAPAPAPAPELPAEPETASEPVATAERIATTGSSARRRATPRRTALRDEVARDEVAPSRSEASTDRETAAFAAAHDAHFRGGQPTRALAAWNTYLEAFPHGRYELEARYNRALSLARLGRFAQARTALEAFADGRHGGYRASEASALIEALDRQIAEREPTP